MSNLDRAEKALASNDVRAALEALLDAWREKRAPAYADAVDALSKAAATHPTLDTHEAWMALALANDAVDVGPLVDALLAAKISTLGGRVEQLATRPDDPRVAMAFARAALEPPFTASSNFGIWSKMYDAMKRIGDPRIAKVLQRRLDAPQGDSQFWPRHYKALEKVLKKLPEAPKVSADEKKQLAAIVKAAKTARPAAPAPKTKKKKAAAPSGDPLERAAIAAESGAWRDCLTALLEAWRPLRIAPLGAAIERVSAILEDGRPPPHGKKTQAAWLAMAAKKDVADVGLLAESSSDVKNAEAESFMDQMATWPEDPRIGRAMLSKAIAMTFADRSRAWTLLGNLIVRNADERFKDAVAYLATDRTDNKARNGCISRVAKELGPVLAKIEHVLGPVDDKHLRRVDAAVDAYHASDAPTERKLIADIVREIDADGPRLVYADWLTERGHPRGELIVLQCAQSAGTATPQQLKRIAELPQEYLARAFLGPIANLIFQNLDYTLRTNPVLERGLVKRLPLTFAPPGWTFAESPLLATIEEVNFGARGRDAFMDIVRAAPRLRVVDGLPIEVLGMLCQLSAPTAIRELSLSYWREIDTPLATVLPSLDGVGLSRLEVLEFMWARHGGEHCDGLPEAMIASPLMKNVERIAVGSPNLVPLLAGLKKHKRKVKTITVVQKHHSVVRADVKLDAALSPTSVEILGNAYDRQVPITHDHAKPLYDLLRTLSAPRLTEIRIVKGLEISDAVKKRLEALAAERFPGAAVRVR